MAKNSANIRIGECEIWENAYSAPGSGTPGGTLIGHTKGGVKLKFDRTFTDLLVDQYGEMPLDMALTGQNLTIEVTFAEVTNEYVAKANPEGRYDATASDSKLGFGRDAGFLLSTTAKQLVFHPRSLGVNNQNEDIYIFKAVSVDAVELEYTIDNQRLLKVTYRALVDETQVDGARLGRVGNILIS